MKTFSYDQIFGEKQQVLFVTAHPDDILVYYAALVHRLRRDHKNVFVLTVSNGARGSGDTRISETELADLRIREERAALKFLGVPEKHTLCLNYRDGEVESNYKLIGEIVHAIRTFRADIVCTHEPTAIYQQTYNKDGYFVQHRDHRKVAEAVVDAVYPFSRDRSFFPQQLTGGVEPRTLYDILMTDEIGSNAELDYTDELETKKSAMRIHKSQFDESFIDDVVNTVRSGDRYVEKYFYVHLLW